MASPSARWFSPRLPSVGPRAPDNGAGDCCECLPSVLMTNTFLEGSGVLQANIPTPPDGWALEDGYREIRTKLAFQGGYTQKYVREWVGTILVVGGAIQAVAAFLIEETNTTIPSDFPTASAVAAALNTIDLEYGYDAAESLGVVYATVCLGPMLAPVPA